MVLSPSEGQTRVALIQVRHKWGEGPDAGLRQQIVTRDSPESQARPSEIHRAAPGEEGLRGAPHVEDARGLLFLDEAVDAVARGKDGGTMPGIQGCRGQLQGGRGGLARVWTGQQDERQSLLHRVTSARRSA